MATRTISRFITRPRLTPVPVAVAPVSVATPKISVGLVDPQKTFIPYYDPSRIFKDIKVVTDLRQSGAERGEVQTGDNGILSPSEAPSGAIVAGGGVPGQPVTPAIADNKLIPIALAVAAFVLFGG